MNIKELENQLTIKLSLEIGLTIIVWLAVVAMIGYRLWQAGEAKEQPLTIMNNVPSIKQSDLEVLRTSIKTNYESNLRKARPEPFDETTPTIINSKTLKGGE